MKAVEMKKGIYWVGGIDWDIRNFHGYLTQRGTTYNAYLIIDEKITLVDTTKYYLVDELLERVSSIVDPSKIDYVISNHVEMDHSGGLPRVMEIAKNATLVTAPNGAKGLAKHYDTSSWNIKTVSTGDKLELGKRSIEFILTPMVHWPDNMVGYMPEEKILFSNDSFGQHIASSERFDDEFPSEIIIEEAKKYYANIVMSYGMQVGRELKEASGLDIEMIAPSHGLIFRKHVKEIIDSYVKWSSNIVGKKALIVYDTMWGSTKKMAYALQDAFEEKGYMTSMKNLQNNHISDIITEVLDVEYICVGSPTLNNNMLPTVASFLTYLKGLTPKNRKAIAFGSYGWGGQSVAQIEQYLSDSKFDIKLSKRLLYIPSEENLEELKEELKKLL
ncbi:FprA family A-type flavoprotein [Haliovirga abyssi]|uniref:Flavodoxin-like domain-containing protein n=1 Tax=Haliovirga abyssi TaxID=2996794 RepID=A0AAU9DV67_9FUSO|nr:FprA family A-type flavoprotein [Haliovirga abyssi]BDU51219.1 hypothetical protein HLVA_17880 [Haliovirga abyssi]